MAVALAACCVVVVMLVPATSVRAATSGRALAWGQNANGQLGDGTGTQRTAPVRVHGAGDLSRLFADVVSVSGGNNHSLALKSDRTVWAWGSNTFGQLGDGTTTPRTTPVQVLGPGGTGYITDIVGIAAGLSYSLALKSDGTVWGWGTNGNGQLGDGTTTQQNTPVQVVGPGGVGYLTDVIGVADFSSHSLALKSDGTVWAWGMNSSGQLGDGTTTQRTTPVQVLGSGGVGFLTGVSAVAAGNAHSLALKSDGTVWAWGTNGSGQLGDGTNTQRTNPVQVLGSGGVGFLTGVSAVAAGTQHSLAVISDGTVWAWGSNLRYQLGDGTNTQRTSPVQVKGPGGVGFLTGVSAASAGSLHSLALKSDGTVWAWGFNGNGQLGDGTASSRSTPVQAKGLGAGTWLTDVAAISAGRSYSLAVQTVWVDYTITAGVSPSESGDVTGAGAYDLGETVQLRATPRTGSNFVNWTEDGTEVSTSANYSFACAGNRTLQANFGLQTYTITVAASPPEGGSVSGAGTFTHIDTVRLHAHAAAGYQFVCWTSNGGFVSTDPDYSFNPDVDCAMVALFGGTQGRALGFGLNDNCQLGDGTTNNRNLPVNVVGPGGASIFTDAVAVRGGGYHGVVLRSDKSVWAWGLNNYGQLGDGTYGQRSTPVQVVGPGGSGYLSDITQASAGLNHSLALKSDGTVWTWGRNAEGQLGNGTTIESTTPVQVVGPGGAGYLTGIVAVFAGYLQNAALKDDGTLWTWGNGFYGQLGNGSTADSSVPVQVLGPGGVGFLTGVKAVSDGSGNSHIVAVLNDGTVWSWGCNDNGQLGNGTNNNSSVPIQVLGVGGSGNLTGASSVNCGARQSFAVMNDGTVTAWGWNADGELGDGTVNNSLVPVQVLGPGGSGFLDRVVEIRGGYSHTIARRDDGTAWAWGDNAYGELGDGTNSDRHTPVQAQRVGGSGSIAGVRHIAGGWWFSLATTDLYGITVSASPSEGGDPSGAGGYYPGDTVQLHAPPNAGYHFVNWTEGGTEVSTDPDFSFTAAADRVLVANFEFVAPDVTGITPGAGSRGQTLTGVLIDGTDFRGPESNVTVQLKNGVDTITGNATNVTATRITADFTIPPGATLGLWDVCVKHNDDGKNDTLTSAFDVQYPPPDVVSISPVSGNRGQTLTGVLIGGTDFRGPESNVTVELKNGADTITGTVTNVTATRITADFTIPGSATVGLWDVYVKHNDDGKSDTLAGAFDVQYPPPTLTSITPDNGAQGQTMTAVATGSNVRGPASNLTVELRKTGEPSIPLTVTAPWTVQFTIPANAAPGAWDLYLEHNDDHKSATLTNGFTVRDAKITWVNPTHANRGETLDVAIVGTDTAFVNATSVASFGTGVTVNSTTVTDATHATANVTIDGAATAGTRDVNVVTGGETPDPLAGGFDVQYPPPVIDSITPNTGKQGATVTAVATGSNVRGPANNLTVELRKTGQPSIPLTVTAPWTVQFTIPTDAARGAWDLYLEHNDDHKSCTLANAFTVEGFTLTPTTGSNGTIDPDTVQTVDYGAGQAFDFTPHLGYQVADVKVDSVSVGHPDHYDFVDVTSDHTIDVTFSQIPKPPVITSISPDRGPVGTTVTINGNYFGARYTSGRGVKYAISPSYCMFNQTECVEYLSWSNTRITCKVPQGAVPGPVTVTTARGTSNADHTFTPTVPLTPFYFLAEGSTAHGFDTYINIENPTGEDLNCSVNFLLSSGKMHTEMVGLPKMSQTTLNPADFIGAQDFSTRVDCIQGKMIAVDRTMVWRGEGAPSPEAHSSIGTTSPQKTWYLAEGSSQWGFETWTLVENPNNAPTKVTLSYMIENGPVRELEKTIPANSRASYSMQDDIGQQDSSVLVTSDLPVVTERSMYRDNRREGSCSMGTPSPGSNFYLAEGTSAWGFTTYVLIQNPNPTPASITLTYMTAKGGSPQTPFTMGPNSRKTVRVNDTIPDTDFSIQVSTDKPVVAERAMYWGADTPQGEACHASSGVCSAHETYYLPDGSTQEGTQTYTLVENPNSIPVQVEVSYLMPGGKDNVTFTDSLKPNSRKTYSMADKIPDGRASIKVTSKTPNEGIVVERSMYWNNRGAGTDTIGAYVDSL
jgi:alpha-tubulin suppressor-like RCC1 family protein